MTRDVRDVKALGVTFGSVKHWKPLVFVLCLLPFASLVVALLTARLGPNPIEVLTDKTGENALRFLLISLAITPLRHITGKLWLLRYRRMLGLFAFFYVACHVLIYAVLDQQLDVTAIVEDIIERPYVLAGTTGFLILLPLALTSTRGMVKRLGKRWLPLHRWVYLAGAAAVVHFVLLAKGDLIEPFVYLAVLVTLLGYRFLRLLR